MVPLTCGKLQSWRGLGVVLLTCAMGLAAAAQGSARAPQEPVYAPRGLIVSSTLEHLAPPAVGASVEDTEVGPADELIVSVRFTNASAHVVDSIRITSPVPPDVQYVPGSASAPGGEVLFSIDNARTFGRPDELVLGAADGEVRPADPAEYTHVRWIMRTPLDAGATGIARFRAVPR
jgi:hypothetical protein